VTKSTDDCRVPLRHSRRPPPWARRQEKGPGGACAARPSFLARPLRRRALSGGRRRGLRRVFRGAQDLSEAHSLHRVTRPGREGRVRRADVQRLEGALPLPEHERQWQVPLPDCDGLGWLIGQAREVAQVVAEPPVLATQPRSLRRQGTDVTRSPRPRPPYRRRETGDRAEPQAAVSPARMRSRQPCRRALHRGRRGESRRGAVRGGVRRRSPGLAPAGTPHREVRPRTARPAAARSRVRSVSSRYRRSHPDEPDTASSLTTPRPKRSSNVATMRSVPGEVAKSAPTTAGGESTGGSLR